MIPSYGTNNSAYLNQVMEEFSTVTNHDIHFIIYTTEQLSFKNANVTLKQYPYTVGKALTHKYRNDLLSMIDDYDVFIYLEDDMLVTKENLETFLLENSKLPDNYVVGFLRYEIKNGTRFLNELSKNQGAHSTIPHLMFINKRKYFQISNVHQGSFALEKRNLKRMITNGSYNVPMGTTLEDAASNFYYGVWPGTPNGLIKVYPADSIDKLLIYHLSEKHTNFKENLNLTTVEELKSHL